MSVKASISISEQQDAFARDLVAQGRFPSVSAVVQQGLEMMRTASAKDEAELAVLQAFFKDRSQGQFQTVNEAKASASSMIARKRAQSNL